MKNGWGRGPLKARKPPRSLKLRRVKKKQKPLLGREILLARADAAMDIPCMPVPTPAWSENAVESRAASKTSQDTLKALEAMVEYLR